MGMQFVGGPYDGMEIDHTLVDRHARIVPLSGDLGTRLFVFMPPRESWDALLRGERAPIEPTYPYERVFALEGARLETTTPGAFDQAVVESNLKVHPRAHTALSALSDEDRQAVITAAANLQKSDPASWPSHRVPRPTADKPVYLLRVSPDLVLFFRVLETGRIELFDVTSEETMRLFLERYRAGSGVA